MEDIKCYWKKLLLTYASLLDYKVTRNPDYNEIPNSGRRHSRSHATSKSEL